MDRVLDISGIVPSKIFLPYDLRNHGRDPALVLQRFESHVLRVFNCWVSCIITLERITTSANAAFNFSELAAGFAFPGRQAIGQAGHFTGPRQRTSNIFCFFNFHDVIMYCINNIISKIIIVSSMLIIVLPPLQGTAPLQRCPRSFDIQKIFYLIFF